MYDGGIIFLGLFNFFFFLRVGNFHLVFFFHLIMALLDIFSTLAKLMAIHYSSQLFFHMFGFGLLLLI